MGKVRMDKRGRIVIPLEDRKRAWFERWVRSGVGG